MLEDIATRFLKRAGFESAIYADERNACSSVEKERRRGHWPLLLTNLDTAGEKPYEEFATAEEEPFEIGLPNLKAVRYMAGDRRAIDELMSDLGALLESHSTGSGTLTKDLLKAMIARVEPGFLQTHRDARTSLDQRL